MGPGSFTLSTFALAVCCGQADKACVRFGLFVGAVVFTVSSLTCFIVEAACRHDREEWTMKNAHRLNGNAEQHRRQVLAALWAAGRPMTRRQIAHHTGEDEAWMNTWVGSSRRYRDTKPADWQPDSLLSRELVRVTGLHNGAELIGITTKGLRHLAGLIEADVDKQAN